MLLFCRRMCHQLLLASNCFLSTSFLQIGLSISPRCYSKISKNFLRTRKIMVMHSNERGECDLRTLVDRQRKR